MAEWCGRNLLATTRERWTLPSNLVFFKHTTNCLGLHSESLARPLRITLGRASRFGLGFNVASYILDSFDDCIRKRGFLPFYFNAHSGVFIITPICPAVVLSALNHSLETGLTIRLVLTVSGNLTYTHKNDHAAPTGEPVNDLEVYTTPLVRQPSDPSTPSASHERSIPQATARARSVRIKPRPSHQLASLPENGASLSTGTACN